MHFIRMSDSHLGTTVLHVLAFPKRRQVGRDGSRKVEDQEKVINNPLKLLAKYRLPRNKN